MSTPPTLALLAGGQSHRMGRDKALLPVGQATWLSHLAAEGLAAGCNVVVVGRTRPDDWPLDEVEFTVDDQPGQGPLGGLATALARTEGDVLALACDMPLVDRAALGWLLERAASRPRAPIVAAVREPRQVEPLFAVYRQAVRGHVERRLARGERSLQRLIVALDAVLVAAPESIADKLANVNDPQTLDRLAARLGEVT